jgi:tetratricopeptide (TPR) repeat protein
MLPTLLFMLASPAIAEPVEWSLDPDLIPWETLTTVPDAGREPAGTLHEVEIRQADLNHRMESGAVGVEVLVEMGDLFRDEARLVLTDDAADPWRIPLETTPACLQLELALEGYERARVEDERHADPDGRIALLEAVTRSRLGQTDTALEAYANVIRSYRRTPYADIAKLAVGDLHVRKGRLDKARAAYKLVRNHKDRELRAYARYRLAHVFARMGEGERAVELLDPLSDTEGTPLVSLIRDASRSALANHMADHLDLPEMIEWMDTTCASDEACLEELREASARSFTALGQISAGAYLLTLDRIAPLEHDVTARVELSALAIDRPAAPIAIDRVERLCAEPDDSCRADVVHALAEYLEEIGDPDTMVVREYERLPKLSGRPQLSQELGNITRNRVPAAVALDRMESMCPDPACKTEVRSALIRAFDVTWRPNDARWLRMLAVPPPLPGPPAQQASPSAQETLAALQPLRPHQDCVAETRSIVADVYANIGRDRDASWVASLRGLSAAEASVEDRALAAVARQAVGASDALEWMGRTCSPLGTECFTRIRGSLQSWYEAAGRHEEAEWLTRVDELGRLGLRPASLLELLEVIRDGASAYEGLDRLELACEGDPACFVRVHVAWTRTLQLEDRLDDVARIEALPPEPVLIGRTRARAALGRAVETDLDPIEALGTVVSACDDDDPPCRRAVVNALADHYERAGRSADANRVRSQPK